MEDNNTIIKKTYYNKNRDKLRDYQKKYYEINKNYISEYNRLYYSQHKTEYIDKTKRKYIKRNFKISAPKYIPKNKDISKKKVGDLDEIIITFD